jgi:mRNA-degrading endonuclease RelE of RelBE toxin-antitoxin system
LEKDFKNPFHFKKSIYSDDENIRDYVFEEYVIVYEIDIERQIVSVSDL